MKHFNVSDAQFGRKEQQNLMDCLRSGHLSMGKYVEQFEQQFAQFVGVSHAVTVMNGTAALHLALKALNVKPGDEVIIPALTYIATANAVSYCGAVPVLVDVEHDSWNMSAYYVRKAITPKTVGILPVHLYGVPANMVEILEIADQHGLWVLEDSAEAHGAKVHDKLTGSLGHVGMFSFYGNKIITCGEGGMLTTNDPHLARRMRWLRGQGQGPERYVHTTIGYNYRMTDMQAAIGVAQLDDIATKLAQRKRVADRYRELCEQHGLRYQKAYQSDTSAEWMFSVVLPVIENRKMVMKQLEALDVETRPVFPMISKQPAYRSAVYPHFQQAEVISHYGINLPTHAGMTVEDVDVITARLVHTIR